MRSLLLSAGIGRYRNRSIPVDECRIVKAFSRAGAAVVSGLLDGLGLLGPLQVSLSVWTSPLASSVQGRAGETMPMTYGRFTALSMRSFRAV